jgi:subtilisin family serine protease
VAVLDTGADLDHPALAGKLVQGFDFVDLDTDPSEEGVYGQDMAYGHGTHVAGLIALAAPDAKIEPIRILKPNGTGSTWALAEGIRFAVSSNVGVINLSYTFRLPAPSRLIEDLLAELTAPTDPVIVAAAGNNGPSTRKEYPAGEELPAILAIAASTENDTLSDFSTRGSWVSVAAPGQNILSSVPEETYATWSGTSMATPLTAGTAALVRAAYPSLSPAEVANRIKTTSVTITGPVPHRVDSAAALGLSN